MSWRHRRSNQLEVPLTFACTLLDGSRNHLKYFVAVSRLDTAKQCPTLVALTLDIAVMMHSISQCGLNRDDPALLDLPRIAPEDPLSAQTDGPSARRRSCVHKRPLRPDLAGSSPGAELRHPKRRHSGAFLRLSCAVEFRGYE